MRRGVTLRAPVFRETTSPEHGRTQGDAPTHFTGNLCEKRVLRIIYLPRNSFSRSFKSRRKILPDAVLGMTSMNSIKWTFL